MKYWNKAIISFVLIVSLISTMILPEQNSALANDNLQITEDDFIKAEGKKLKTKSGEEVILKGTNAGGYLLQEMWMTLTQQTDNVGCQAQIIETLKERFPDNYQTLLDVYEEKYWQESDFDNCQQLGMNVIRLPFWYKNFLDDNGKMKTNAFDRIDWFIEQAGKRGIYVILDMHGVPGSQNGQDHSGDTTQGVSFFQGSNASENQQTAINLWVEIAKHYQDNPTVAGYDLLNEPYTSESIQLTTRTVWDYYDKAYDAIRAVDGEHVIIMEATWEPSRLPNPTEYGWTNVMYEYHCYNYDSQTVAEDQLASINKKLDNIDKANYNVPSYIGETSFFSNYDSWRACLQRMNDYGISYTTWTYKTTNKNSSWGIFNQTSSEADIENDSYDTIYTKWSNASQCRKNTTLYNVLAQYLNQPSLRKSEGTGRYEAELYDEKVNGGSATTLTTNFGNSFSNDGYVENMNDNHSTDMGSAKYIQFNIKMNHAGKYKLRVGYATTTDTRFAVQVNDGEWSFQDVYSTGAWDSVNTAEMYVEFNRGENIVKITGSVDVTDSWIILDYFEVEEEEIGTTIDPSVYPAAAGIHEAEAAQELNGNTIESGDYYADCSGQAVVGVGNEWIANDRKYIQWTVNALEAGVYTLKLSYCSPKQAEFLYSINGESWKVFDDEAGNIGNVAPATGDWNTAGQISTKIYLYEGANTIAVSGPIVDNSTSEGNYFTVYDRDFGNSSSANLDCIELLKEGGNSAETTEKMTTALQTDIPTTSKTAEILTTKDDLSASETTKMLSTTKSTAGTTINSENSKTSVNKQNKVTSLKKPARVKVKKAKYKNKKILLKYKKVKGAKGYQIRYAANKKFKKSKKINTRKLKYTIKKIRKKKYYIQVRAYIVSNGKKVYGKWSKRKMIKTR